MNDFRLEINNCLGSNQVNCIVEDNGKLDIIACKVLKNDCPPFLANFSLAEINGETIIKYDVGDLISISYFSAKLSKNDFLKVWRHLLSPLINCKDWFLQYNSFCFDPKYVFINRHTLEICYIYLPVKSATTSYDKISSLFMGIMQRCELQDGQELQIELYKYFAQKENSIIKLKEIIDRFSSESVCLDSFPSQNIPPKAIPTQPLVSEQPNVQKQNNVSVPKSVQTTQRSLKAVASSSLDQSKESLSEEAALEQELMQSLTGKKEKKPKKKRKSLFSFGKNKKNKKSNKDSKNPVVAKALEQMMNDQPVVQKEIISGAAAQYNNISTNDNLTGDGSQSYKMPDDDVTEVFQESVSTGPHLKLIGQVANHELPGKIDLDFTHGGFSIGRFDLGKAVHQSDFEFPASIKSVSRFHARIEKQKDGYLIIDLVSANGTFVNGAKLAANIPVHIKNGDSIAFSDKGIDYIFME